MAAEASRELRKKKPCFDFQRRGKCSFGARCQYSHTAAESFSGSASQIPATNPKPHKESETETERSYRRWMYMIPQPDNTYPNRRSPAVDIKLFFQTGLNLVEGGDAGTRQQVISKLASENGLQIVNTLTTVIGSSQNDQTRLAVFRDQTMTFYQIISHPDVLSSLILETPIDTIYNFLFGPSGRRGLSVFRMTAAALRTMFKEQGPGGDDVYTIALSCSLAVLDKLIEINQTAQVIDEFTTIVEEIAACISEDNILPNARQCLTRIRRRLNLGSSIPQVSAQPTLHSILTANFELRQDWPGALSHNGARHDNDHANVADIQILPTTQEIASSRQEYLPLLDSNQAHLSGLPGLLDRQFRLLREDTVGQLRDAVREEVTRLGQPTQTSPTATQSRQGVRRLIYHNFRFSRVLVGRRKGLQVLAEFDQPSQVNKKTLKQREDWWKGSKLLQVDSLVCFVSAGGRIIFFSVCDPILPTLDEKEANPRDSNRQRLSEENPSLFRYPGHASVLLSLAEYKAADVMWIVNHLGSDARSRQSLVEFPGVLLPSFQPILQALQQMSKTLDLPFADIVAPESEAIGLTLQAPAYTAQKGFTFNLDLLTAGIPLTLTPGKAFDFAKLNENSTLDEAQQGAVVRTLNSALALIQGPPGTGKSYVGGSIIKILLHNRHAAVLGPIICVCYTNHALDQLLEHLVKDGVKQIIRLGSRSKSEVLEKLTIHHVRKEVVLTKTEKHEKWVYNQAISEIVQEVTDEILPGLNNPQSWSNIRAHLAETHQRHFNELFGRGIDEDGFQQVKGRRYRVVDAWLRGAPKKLTTNRPVEQLATLSLKEMSSTERVSLHRHWISKRTSQLTNNFISSMQGFENAKKNLGKCHSELDLRCLQEAHVIGVTTSSLARNLQLLQRIRAKVMLCEEAGEVLEAHTLTAFLPSVEHAILIGDHEQLRPQINNYELQHDSARGARYALDISLFERLVRRQVGNSKLPLSTLQTQRRMHPSISELVRVPLYPDLQDHPSVSHYPDIDGMRDRLHWFDHREREDSRLPGTISMSRTNSFEVEMVAVLVSHLVRQGTYASDDIAVITPYLGQLQKIKQRLASSFEIVVGDRDQEKLEAEGLQIDQAALSTRHVSQVQKTTLLKALRIASVDNFQGEEAKVIIVSLVRSNDERKCGFLKTSNRINVLLSRARHGMYIIGNADTARSVKMWDQVISLLEQANNIGPSLALCCPRHKDTPIDVSSPDDFIRLAPEGGCAERCTLRLKCGHSCPNMCHSASLHNAVHCMVRCPRTKSGCEHECPKPCGDLCDQKCQINVSNVPLPCGHVVKRLKCYEAQNPESIQCQKLVQVVMNHCKHTITVRCHQLPLSIDHPCTAVCEASLPCGHKCSHPCHECKSRSDGKVVETDHHVCRTPCGRPYTTCGHSCKAACHGDQPCPSCTEPCQVSCHHSKCSKLCNEPCVPCAESCSWECPHRGRCPLPCSIPCDMLPCSERCAIRLSCGHQCPSVCGETCPDARYCQICGDSKIKEMVVDFILSSTFEEADLDESPCIIPSCGHILTLESMDGHMSMADFYTTNDMGIIVGLKTSSEPFSASSMKNCPTCRGPLRNLNRYSRIVRRAMIDEATKKFIVWANSNFIPLVARMQEIEEGLRDDAAGQQKGNGKALFEATLAGPLLLNGTRDQQVSHAIHLMHRHKYRDISSLRRDIKMFLKKVDETEQPFGRIFDLAQDATRHRGTNIDLSSGVNILSMRNRILTTVLLIRCDYTILSTLLNNQKGDDREIQVNFSASRTDCERLIVESMARNQPATVVEGHLYWARFLVLERSFAEPSEELSELLEDAREHLRVAKNMCDLYPGSTQGMIAEVEEAQKMLRGDTFYLPVSNNEKAAVYAAMAREFTGTGHWYYCVNGHPFTVGECGMPMATSTCPQCGSPVGGRNHQPVEGVRRADDLEEQFGRLNFES